MCTEISATQMSMVILFMFSFISLFGEVGSQVFVCDFAISPTHMNVYSSVCIKYCTISELKMWVKLTHYISPASGVSRAFSFSPSYLILTTSCRLGRVSLILGRVDVSLSLQPPLLLLAQRDWSILRPRRCSPLYHGISHHHYHWPEQGDR